MREKKGAHEDDRSEAEGARRAEVRAEAEGKPLLECGPMRREKIAQKWWHRSNKTVSRLEDEVQVDTRGAAVSRARAGVKTTAVSRT